MSSTHIMSDVERVADTVLLMEQGRLRELVDLDALRKRFTRVSFVFDVVPDGERAIPEARSVSKGTREWTAIFEDKTHDDFTRVASELGARDFAEVGLTLEEVFLEILSPDQPGARA